MGASLQYGLLQGSNVGYDDSGGHFALSGHLKNALGPLTLYSQLTYYVYDIADDMPWGSGDLIPMGAYNEATLTASEGVIPALSLRYDGLDASGVSWLDDVTPYVEWSSIVKPTDGFNDSALVTMGAAWTLNGALYVYSELVFSNGSSLWAAMGILVPTTTTRGNGCSTSISAMNSRQWCSRAGRSSLTPAVSGASARQRLRQNRLAASANW